MPRLRLLALLGALTTAVAATPADAAPTRVVALTPFTANTVANIGVRPTAIGEVLGGFDRVSPRLTGVKRLPLSHPNGPNLEQLATLNPQLVLSAPIWAKGEGGMRRLGMKVVESDPTSVSAVPAQTRRIGALLGRSRQARAIAAEQEQSIHAAARRAKRHPRVLLILGVGRTPYAFLRNSWGGDLVTRAGGRLLTQGLSGSGGYARISNEIVVKRNPDIIIAVPHGASTDITKIARFLKSNPAWKGTKAVRNNRLYVSTGNTLLQAWTDVGRSIADIQTKYLRNR